jgi:hypothetical protein
MTINSEINDIIKSKNKIFEFREAIEKKLPPQSIIDFVLYIIGDNLWIVSGHKEAFDLVQAALDAINQGIKNEKLSVECLELANKYNEHGSEKENAAKILYAAYVALNCDENSNDISTAVRVAEFVCSVKIPRHISSIEYRILEMLFDLEDNMAAFADHSVREYRAIWEALSDPIIKPLVQQKTGDFTVSELLELFKRNDVFVFSNTRELHRRLLSAMANINNLEYEYLDLDSKEPITISYSKPYDTAGGFYKIEIGKFKTLGNVLSVLSAIEQTRQAGINAKTLFELFCNTCQQLNLGSSLFDNKIKMKEYIDSNWSEIKKVIDIEFKRPYRTQSGRYYIGCSSRVDGFVNSDSVKLDGVDYAHDGDN